MFYRLDRNQFRIKTDIQGKLTVNILNGVLDLHSRNSPFLRLILTGSTREGTILFPVTEEPGLYEIYRDALGIFSANEADGGWVNTLKAGVVWDSRDNRPNPMKGLWTELGIEIAPGFLGNDWSFSKFYLHTGNILRWFRKILHWFTGLVIRQPWAEMCHSSISHR